LNSNQEISKIKQLIDKGQFNEARVELDKIEKLERYFETEQIEFLLMKSLVLCKSGDFEASLQITEKVTERGNLQKDPQITVDALIIQEEVLWRLGKFDGSLKVINQVEQFLSKLERTKPTIVKEAHMKRHKGVIFQNKGDFDKALEYYFQALDLIEDIGPKLEIGYCLNNIGTLYSLKGDIDQSLKYLEKYLAIIKEYGNKLDIAICFSNMGMNYQQKGKWIQALKFTGQSLNLFEEIGGKQEIAGCLMTLGFIHLNMGELEKAIEHGQQGVKLHIEIGNKRDLSGNLFLLIVAFAEKSMLEQAQEYLQQLSRLNEQESDRFISQQYRFAQAKVLKRSNRIIEKVKSQEILQQLVTEDIYHPLDQFYTRLNLCELLIAELKSYGEQTVFQQIKSLQNEMFSLANKLQSSDLIVKSLIFQARLYLVDGNLQGAEKLLEQAKTTITEEDSSHLKNWITNEIKSLHTEFIKWADLIQQNLPLQERIDHARLAEYITQATRYLQET
jgi:tetratricopeptide (TPR) repeat protein